MTMKLVSIDTNHIFLDCKNPRLESKVEIENDVIDLLCKDEYVIGLAKDIVENGTNPLEIFGVIKDGNEESDYNQNYIVVEGNRRICALKLLHDPERAPNQYKQKFKELSEKWEKRNDVNCVIFSDREAAKKWLERLHGDAAGGITRRKWTPDQKQRFNGNARNAMALDVLDYAERELGLIDQEQRKAKLTTAQRFLSNHLVKKALGLFKNNVNEIFIERKREDVEARLGQFIKDLISGEKVHSRAKKDDFENYAHELIQNISISNDKIDPEPLQNRTDLGKEKKPKKSQQPIKPSLPRKIEYNEDITKLFKENKNLKLEILYFGICNIELEDHFVPILTISCWAFIESLSAAAGRSSETSFKSFYSKKKLKSFGFTESYTTFNKALERLEEAGNTTKHHFVAANFNGQQLANDMKTLEPLVIKTIKDTNSKSS